MAKRPTPSQIARAAARKEAEIRARFDAARAEARAASAARSGAGQAAGLAGSRSAEADRGEDDSQAALAAAKARIEAAGARTAGTGASKAPGSASQADPASRADPGSGTDAGGAKAGAGAEPDTDDEVEYLGRPSGAQYLASLNAMRSAQMAASQDAALDNLANPLGQQSAAMMTEDYRAFLQGSEQLILATSGQAMAILLEDQVKGAEILAVIAVYQAAITAFGAEVSVVAGVMKGEFSS
ncbi:MAG: hypothetical protein RIA71_07870 [Oceanicaulis sp.]